MNVRKWLPLVAVCAGTFMLLVDVTIVTVALPDMARGLHTSLPDLQWVLSLYALVLAALVLTAGALADRIGRRAVYLGGLAVFASASLTGALAQAVISTGSGWAVEVPGLVLVGLGAGLVLGPLSAAAMAAVPGPRAGMAAGSVSTFRQLGYAAGIAVLGEVFRGGLARAAGPRLAGPLGNGQASTVLARQHDLAPLVHHAYAHALDLTFVVASAFGLAAAIAVFCFAHGHRPAPVPSPEPSPASPAQPALVSR
jgi:MFS family permease